MSLLDQFTKIKGYMNQSNTIIDEIYTKDPKFYFEHPNEWHVKKYNYNYGNTTTAPTKNVISTLLPAARMWKATSDRSSNFNWGDNYVGYAELWIYCNTSKYFTFNFWTDDAGQIWVNDVSLGVSTSCQDKSVSCTFKKGLNHIEIMWNELSRRRCLSYKSNLAKFILG